MTFEWWFAYLLTSLILSLSPGSGAINTMTTSISHGYRGAAASIAGLQTGLGIHIVLVGIGLGTLFSRSVLAFEVLKWAGAAYLVWLGIQQWRAAGALDLHTLAQTQSRGFHNNIIYKKGNSNTNSLFYRLISNVIFIQPLFN